jgi:hypothetical protein
LHVDSPINGLTREFQYFNVGIRVVHINSSLPDQARRGDVPNVPQLEEFVGRRLPDPIIAGLAGAGILSGSSQDLAPHHRVVNRCRIEGVIEFTGEEGHPPSTGLVSRGRRVATVHQS